MVHPKKICVAVYNGFRWPSPFTVKYLWNSPQVWKLLLTCSPTSLLSLLVLVLYKPNNEKILYLGTLLTSLSRTVFLLIVAGKDCIAECIFYISQFWENTMGWSDSFFHFYCKVNIGMVEWLSIVDMCFQVHPFQCFENAIARAHFGPFILRAGRVRSF